MPALARALSALAPLPPEERLAAAARRLSGTRAGPLAAFEVASELAPDPDRIDGRLLEAVVSAALDGARGAVFTGGAEAGLLAALGLARLAARRGLDEAAALAALLGGAAPPGLAAALDGVRVLDPCCGGGALLVAALAAARRCGAEPALAGLDVAPLATEAARARLALLGARAVLARADALGAPWPEADLVLANPPFLRHEAIPAREKARAARASGLSRQADLSAHLVAVALRRAPEVALVWPRALDTARSAAPVRAEAAARGGFAYRLRSRVAGSFAASVDTWLAVWSLGGPSRPWAEASAPLDALTRAELTGLARGAGGPRLALGGPGAGAAAPRGAVPLAELCEVRFGVKTGCNAFFHLRRLGPGRFLSALAGEVALPDDAAQPILASLRDAPAPALGRPSRLLFRPAGEDPRVAAYVARGEELGVARRPTCASRAPWWRVAPGRAPAPVLYPAKVGARAFGFLNAAGVWEDKKWHALFPRAGVEPWLLAAVLSATPVRLWVDRGARQLTGSQAIADVDCGVLAAAPVPALAALRPLAGPLARCWAALAQDPVTTDLAAMLARPAQAELDALVGRALGLGPAAVEEARAAMRERLAARLAHAAHVRRTVARAG